MNNKLRQLFKLNAIAFTIVFLAELIFLIPIDYNLRNFYLSIKIFELFTYALFFLALTIEAYSLNTDRGKMFAIIFLIFLGVLLVFPKFLMLNIMFLVIYFYYKSNGSRLEIPLSYITVGYFLLYLLVPITLGPLSLGPIAYIIILYGWLKYIKECRYRF